MALLFAWRVLLSLGLAVLLAWVLSLAAPAFTAAYSLALALLGLVFGTIWQARAEAGVGLFERTEPVRVSKPVAFVGLAFIGALWSGVLWALKVHPLLIAALLLAAPLLVGWWLQQILQRPANVRSVWFAALSLLFGGLPVVLLLRLS
ncbi:MAG: hypothetical protein Q4A28_03325 [Brachymonas sp.]|nr:hypothetical protein [Brachymonas sp.]